MAIFGSLARGDHTDVLLAHHYHRVDPDQVWTIATKNIPELLAQLRASNETT